MGPCARASRVACRARVGGAATSDSGIQVGIDAGAVLLFAPEVVTAGRLPTGTDVPPVTEFLEIPTPASGKRPQLGSVRGFQENKLTALGADTWVYDGSLHLPQPVLLTSKLVVRGSFVCPPSSLLEDDVKCGGSLRIGAGSLCRGNLISRGEARRQEECLFSGDLDEEPYSARPVSVDSAKAVPSLSPAATGCCWSPMWSCVDTSGPRRGHVQPNPPSKVDSRCSENA